VIFDVASQDCVVVLPVELEYLGRGVRREMREIEEVLVGIDIDYL
jgi:hypothetical protein